NAIAQWAQRPRVGGVALDTNTEAGAPDDAESAAWDQEWIAHHYRLAMEAVRRTFEARSVEIFNRSIAGTTVRELGAGYERSEQAVHKVRQRIKARMEELIAEQVREEDGVDV